MFAEAAVIGRQDREQPVEAGAELEPELDRSRRAVAPVMDGQGAVKAGLVEMQLRAEFDADDLDADAVVRKQPRLVAQD